MPAKLRGGGEEGEIAQGHGRSCELRVKLLGWSLELGVASGKGSWLRETGNSTEEIGTMRMERLVRLFVGSIMCEQEVLRRLLCTPSRSR